jgi:acyl carrier protein
MPTPAESERIASVISQFLHERFDIPLDQLSGDRSLRELGLDSILLLDVMLDIEDRLGVSLKDLAMPANPNIGDVVTLVERNMAAAD